MPDILSVSMQDILYSRKPDLREQKIMRSIEPGMLEGRAAHEESLPYACLKGKL